MDVLVAECFFGKEGDVFKILSGEGVALYDLILSGVTMSKVHAYPGKIRDPFSVFFDGTSGQCFEQGIYHLRHHSGWEFDVFLVPIAANTDSTFKYQAVFN